MLTAIGLCATITTRSGAQEADPPERVAMVDLVEGAAASQPAGAGDWVADLANRPLTTGDRLWVDADSRAELHLGSAAIRLGANTGLQFLSVADRVAQLRLSEGTMIVRLRYLSPDETFEVDTPNSAISLMQSGEYRIEVNNAGDAVAVDVWRGQAEVAGQAQSFTLEAQQQGVFQGGDTLAVEFGDLPPADGFDQWAQDRDRREDDLLTANFLSRDVTGYADLDGYGNWQTDPDLGPVWVPRVAAGWVPYSQGYWISVAPWGWTWIDAAPWGFAPFHYGRWVHHRLGWAWCPGQPSVRPVYAPALVAWATGPNNVIAWVALGPNEIYRPWGRVSNGYLRRVNVTNTYIDNTVTLDARTVASPPRYVNQAIPGAMIAVTQETFRSGRDVGREVKPIAAAQAVLRADNPIQPTAKSLLRAPDNGRRVAVMPPRGIFTRPVVARTTPPIVPGLIAEQHRVIVTSVPRAEARSRPAAPPPQPAPWPASPVREPSPATEPSLPRDLPPSREVQPGRDSVPDRGREPVNSPPARTDRPAVLPHPAPAAPPPVIERPPPARKQILPIEPSRRAPEKTPAKPDH
ncbi:MAG: DUF6600 domain-containing protein [Steroidobacterales bacterium]